MLEISCQDRRGLVSDVKLGLVANANYAIYRREVLAEYIAIKRVEPPSWDGQERGLPEPWLLNEGDIYGEELRDEQVRERRARRMLQGGRR